MSSREAENCQKLNTRKYKRNIKPGRWLNIQFSEPQIFSRAQRNLLVHSEIVSLFLFEPSLRRHFYPTWYNTLESTAWPDWLFKLQYNKSTWILEAPWIQNGNKFNFFFPSSFQNVEAGRRTQSSFGANSQQSSACQKRAGKSTARNGKNEVKSFSRHRS